MLRWCKLSLHIMSNEVRKILSYRSDFWVTYFGQVAVQYFVAQALWQNIFEQQQAESIQGYTLQDFKLFYLLSPLITKIMTGENIGFISRDIYEGSLNRYLVYPFSFFHYKWITYFSHSLVYLLQTLLLYFIWIISFDFSFSWQSIIGVLLVLLAAHCYFLLLSTLELISFWAENVWSLGVMLRFVVFFLGGGFLPVDFFPLWLQKMSNLLPFTSMINAPIKVLMNRADLLFIQQSFLTLFCWIALLTFIQQSLWRRGQKQYTGIGM